MNLTRFISFSLMLLIHSTLSAQTGRWEKELSDKNWSLWLDKAALWYEDDIYLPPVDLAKVPVNPPTCGWDKLHNNSSSRTVSVPGTVEEHYWGDIGGAVQDTNGNYVGVSWWSKKFHLDNNLKGKRIILAFQSVNLRAEVFINEKLVGYDVIGNTPFEVNATDAVIFGQDNQLDIRITDPVGNFTWDDNILMRWGKNLIPAVHGFGGITGNVILRATDPVTVSDIYVQNQPDPRKLNIIVTLDNYTGKPQNGTLDISIHEKGNPDAVVWTKTIKSSIPGTSVEITVPAHVPKAKLWELTINKDVRSTSLYVASVKFTGSENKIIDNNSQHFGFRWFDVGEKNGDKRFYLNGNRVVILAAMTRGFWPKNGIFPTQEMAKRDMNAMYDMGLNTMLMHRAIGVPGIFNYADSAGLLAYEEPGGYRVTSNKADNIEGPDEQAFKLRTEKLRRMVIRDRSLPSLVIYNLKNEEQNEPTEIEKQDMLMVHDLDPSRIITYNSGNDLNNRNVDYYTIKANDPMELHMLPFNPSLIYGGWYDHHHWYAYSGYTDEMYRNPSFYLRGVIDGATVPLLSDSLYRLNNSKVIFHGEEGAFSTIVRLQKIKEELDNTNPTGFRELEHLDWFNTYDKFLDETGFRKAYANVDSLTVSLGRNLHYFHGRNIENVRMSNIADAYNMNGWASAATRTDVVDMYRNPTSHISIIRHYTRPLYIAVKIRNKIIPVGTSPVADFFIINEENLKGKHTLNVVLNDKNGNTLFSESYNVNIKGGEEFGQLLVENVKLPLIKQSGYFNLDAVLYAEGVSKAKGFDDIYAVDLNDHTVEIGSCAILENDGIVKNFLAKISGLYITDYSVNSPRISTIIVGNIDFKTINGFTLEDMFRRVQDGTKLVVLSNADKFAREIDLVLRNRPRLVIPSPLGASTGQGGPGGRDPASGLVNVGSGNGRFFVGFSPLLAGLPQAQGMSWEYQCFYKGAKSLMGDVAIVQGVRLNWSRVDLIVALGRANSKEIISALSRVPVGKGTVTLSTLNMIPNLSNNYPAAVIAKKLFLNILEY